MLLKPSYSSMSLGTITGSLSGLYESSNGKYYIDHDIAVHSTSGGDTLIWELDTGGGYLVEDYDVIRATTYNKDSKLRVRLYNAMMGIYGTYIGPVVANHDQIGGVVSLPNLISVHREFYQPPDPAFNETLVVVDIEFPSDFDKDVYSKEVTIQIITGIYNQTFTEPVTNLNMHKNIIIPVKTIPSDTLTVTVTGYISYIDSQNTSMMAYTNTVTYP